MMSEYEEGVEVEHLQPELLQYPYEPQEHES